MTPGQIIGSALIGASGAATVCASIANATGFDFSPLLATGPIGIVCGWFMLRMEGRTKALEAEIGRLNVLITLLLVEVPIINESTKAQAKRMQQELEDARKRRDGK